MVPVNVGIFRGFLTLKFLKLFFLSHETLFFSLARLLSTILTISISRNRRTFCPGCFLSFYLFCIFLSFFFGPDFIRDFRYRFCIFCYFVTRSCKTGYLSFFRLIFFWPGMASRDIFFGGIESALGPLTKSQFTVYCYIHICDS